MSFISLQSPQYQSLHQTAI
jgi:hypothetical protein